MESRLEEQYLREYDPSQYDRPSVTVDILVFTICQKKLCALLIKRDMPPFIGKWAIPGGFIKMDESADQAAARKLKEETGIEGVRLEQLYTFSSVERDPRTRVISIVYFTAIPYDKLKFGAGTGALGAELFTVGQIQGGNERERRAGYSSDRKERGGGSDWRNRFRPCGDHPICCAQAAREAGLYGTGF